MVSAFAVCVTACGTTTAADPGRDASSEDAPEDAGPWVPKAEPGLHAVTVVDTRQVIPGPGLPAESPAQNSNNNLDVVRHGGKVYLAWRTGPDHYASDKTKLYVLSSSDEKTWSFETEVSAGFDLREPRFLSLNGSLFLYLARLGNDPNRFEPKGMSPGTRGSSALRASIATC